LRQTRLVVIVMLSMSILLCLYPVLPAKAENVLPMASFTYSPEYPQPYEMVAFNASQSHDPDGYIVRFEWDFGDGYEVTTTEPIVGHAYYEDGTYQVVLTVVDNDGGRGVTFTNVVVNCHVWFRVVDASGNPISNVVVTMYYANSKTSTNWQVAPAGPNEMEIRYDLITQPDLAQGVSS